MNVELYRPIAKVTFFTESGELVARATNNPSSAIDDDIISISTTRELQSDSPTFSIELPNRKQLHQWIASNDLILIDLSRPPEKLATVFVGLVDDCRKKTSVSGNAVTRSISVVGRGVAKSLIRFDVGVVPEAEYSHTSMGWLLAAGVSLAGSSPADVAESIWKVLCEPHINYKWSNGKALFDYALKDFSDRPLLKLLDVTTIMNWQGSIHSLLKDVAEEPFYEVFWEMKDNKDTLNIRPTPFNVDDWDKLESHTIYDRDVVRDDIGRSDVETFSIFSVGAKTLFSANDTYKTFGVKPFWNEDYSNKYGNARLHVETSYTSVADGVDSESQITTMRSMMVDLYNWNIKNNSMRNGTLVVKGSNKYKVGTRVVYDSTEDGSKYEYYVVSVTHTFVNFGGPFITILGVTRGLPVGERFTAPWGTYTEYSGLGILPFDPVGSRDALINAGNGVLGQGPVNDELYAPSTGDVDAVLKGARKTMTEGINGAKIRYVFGGNTPNSGSLDCSSWTQYVYKTYANVDIGRVTGQQVTKGTQIDKGKLLPGDLVFFKGTYNSTHIYGVSHVGIYLGNGEFIHNSSGQNGIAIGQLSDNYWISHWLMGRRVLTASTITATGKGAKFQATGYGATALNLMGGPGWVPTFKTAIGVTPIEGRTIAVDRSVIPLHSLVRVECPSYPKVNGEYVAEDVGGAIKGNKIDIYFDDIPPKDAHATRRRLLDFGRREVLVTVLRKGKG